MPPWVRRTSRSRRSALLRSEADSSRRLRDISVPSPRTSCETTCASLVICARFFARACARSRLRLFLGLLVQAVELLAARLQQPLGLLARLLGDARRLFARALEQLLACAPRSASARRRVGIRSPRSARASAASSLPPPQRSRSPADHGASSSSRDGFRVSRARRAVCGALLAGPLGVGEQLGGRRRGLARRRLGLGAGAREDLLAPPPRLPARGSPPRGRPRRSARARATRPARAAPRRVFGRADDARDAPGAALTSQGRRPPVVHLLELCSPGTEAPPRTHRNPRPQRSRPPTCARAYRRMAEKVGNLSLRTERR